MSLKRVFILSNVTLFVPSLSSPVRRGRTADVNVFLLRIALLLREGVVTDDCLCCDVVF